MAYNTLHYSTERMREVRATSRVKDVSADVYEEEQVMLQSGVIPGTMKTHKRKTGARVASQESRAAAGAALQLKIKSRKEDLNEANKDVWKNMKAKRAHYVCDKYELFDRRALPRNGVLSMMIDKLQEVIPTLSDDKQALVLASLKKTSDSDSE